MSVIALMVGSVDATTSAAGIKVQPVDLATLDPEGMPVGAAIYDTSGNIWTLTVSTATVDGSTTEAVAGCAGLRWIKGSGGGGGGGGGTTPNTGTALTDANATINPATDAASEYTLPVTTLTTARTLTLGNTGSPVTGAVVEIVRRDLTANTYTIKDNAATTLFTFGASPSRATAASFYFNGSNYAYLSFRYVA